jgi:protein-S-isoprenylcysteine O-methyltransferase Ste14
VFLRAVLAFIAMPGIVAYVVPLLLAPADAQRSVAHQAGVVLVVAGTVLLLSCVRDFYVSGRGTLAPWSPPRHLVTSGAYAMSRNPMYVAVLTVVLGWAIWFASAGLLIYAVVLGVAFHLRIVRYEEPRLRKSFGEEWQGYRERVPRWIGRPG